LWRHYLFFLFLILEFVSFIFIINHSYYQRATIISSANGITGYVYNTTNSITGYFGLKKANKELAEENARLRSLESVVLLATDTLQHFREDSTHKQLYRYINAKVISNSISKRNNYLLLNKGLSQGVGNDMAVITPKGVVGIVKNVSLNFSSVLSVLHKQTRISAKIKKNNQLGTLIWQGTNYRVGTVKDIPTHIQLNIGDTITTSGFSYIFPEEIPIGSINEYYIREGDNFYTIKLDFFVDYNNLSNVMVVDNLMKKEQDSLAKKSIID
ncbi:MAG: rod shape-determining protein MreC, partial [Bacteroidales bacterium]|nr:rod shape-determining protein MreC [Bacteroidales bacterium]